jgi:hypothetical protein
VPEAEAAAGAPDAASGGGSGPQASGGSSGGNLPLAGNAGADCDQDGDQHLARGRCGGDDCDDSDADVSPDQTGYFADRHETVGYDYDCSGAPEQEHLVVVDCSGLSLVTCPTEDVGFLGSLPMCGQGGRWGRCVKDAVLNTCEELTIEEELAMRCR